MDKERRQIVIQGTVQGVGFRPFVYRLASELSLAGWVVNSPQGVVVEAEAQSNILDIFSLRLQRELPPNAAIDHFDSHVITPLGEHHFEIRTSNLNGAKTALILPDLATCPDCLRDIQDPTNRRYHYPFTNCTHCGPRFSIIQALPYDRTNTTMRGFQMCAECRAEYENPLDRRFHAQPNACPHCGPQLTLLDKAGQTLHLREDALLATAQAIREGKIVAIKGLGGFQLLTDARNNEAVLRLRQRKGRYEKPFAVMYPTITQVKGVCSVSSAEEQLLKSVAAPIVLLHYVSGEIAPSVAPENPYMGVMLPYTPLHHLLLSELNFPIVATSGNLSGEPIIIDNHQALAKLGNIADVFLMHNRPIARHVDDSVTYLFDEQPVMLRRARGYAPTPIHVESAQIPLAATGAQQKNTLAVAHHQNVFLSQHLGDMENLAALDAFTQTLTDFKNLYELHPAAIACDLHPDYATTRYAEQSGLPIIPVQHHYAHVLSCMAEHDLNGSALGVAWDGTGYGTDGTIWGGEFLRVDAHGFERVAHLAPFRLPGGELAIREPRRSALGVLYEIYGDELPKDRLDFTPKELQLILKTLHQQINAPITSSAGRLFDAVAALIGLRQRCSFEGQAAMALEFAQYGTIYDECYPFLITPVTRANGGTECIIDWKPMIVAMLAETSVNRIAAKFHNTLAKMVVNLAQQVGEPDVILTGGCFQNRTLLGRTVKNLREAGFRPFWQQRIPPNDGGIALGQIMAALREVDHVLSSTRQNNQR